MKVEDVRFILERTFLIPVSESDAKILINRLCELQAKENAQSIDCQCDLQDSPNAPVDWHGENCPCYRPRK